MIVNHSKSPFASQLKMYIGGMGGTGKSTVLHALKAFFASQSESYCISIVAPTATAAALLGGVTYHSLLGFSGEEDDDVPVARIKSKLDQVDYIFFDEVSMLSSWNMFRISKRLEVALNVTDFPFGNMNMIFAGDFAQLPPAVGGDSVSLYSHTIGSSSATLTLRGQQATLGKLLWHQIDTVVMLRKNMRQSGMSIKDLAFRKALENMRYKACTHEDIVLLKNMISSRIPGKPSFADKPFRDVSIITTWNKQKDAINAEGSYRFAKEQGQKLKDFFSEDSIQQEADVPHIKRPVGKRKIWKSVPEAWQEDLWKQPHATSNKHVPAVLSLCVGLPVMIKYNVATELCITNGQEGRVAGWEESTGKHGKPVLECVFVELMNPPKSVNIKGLPPNVVPITKSKTTINCTLSSDQKISVQRLQVHILPSFAMTDYASQGKTRPVNVVDLSNSRDHKAMYTVLSRGTSATNTIIVQGFASNLVTGGCMGSLRTEFRELEILDDITYMCYSGSLPTQIQGLVRKELISTYRHIFGKMYMPKTVHKVLRHNEFSDVLNLKRHNEDELQVEKQQKSQKIALEQTPSSQVSSHSSNTSGFSYSKFSQYSASTSQITQVDHDMSGNTLFCRIIPRGAAWCNNSCAYDSVSFILCGILHLISGIEALDFYNEVFSDTSKAWNETHSISATRDVLHEYLTRSEKYPEFVYNSYASARKVWEALLTDDKFMAIYHLNKRCMPCNNDRRTKCFRSPVVDQTMLANPSIAFGMKGRWQESQTKCRKCQNPIHCAITWDIVPPIIVWDIPYYLNSDLNLYLDQILTMRMDNTYELRGLINYTTDSVNSHYTATTFSTDWSYAYEYDGTMRGGLSVEREIQVINGKIKIPQTSVLAVYALCGI
jgi:hypothetical protein